MREGKRDVSVKRIQGVFFHTDTQTHTHTDTDTHTHTHPPTPKDANLHLCFGHNP